MPTVPSLDLTRLAIVGTYLPRRCGIATFTTDLANAIGAEMGNPGQIFALAIDDTPEGYRYPDRVRFQIRASVQADYRLAADYIASRQVNAVILQHEYGLFGGPCGAHILRLLRELRIPVLTTLHTVLAEPSAEQQRVMDELGQISDRLVVMSQRAIDMLNDIYNIPREKIAFIPHGIPDVPFVDSSFYKDQFRAESRRVILTFGLLSPGKGIEHMIEAMPAIAKEYPDILYIVLGATHPHLKQQYGEAYRTSLQRRVEDLGLTENVRFRNQFVELDELCEYIGAADLYVTPYVQENQITSGTLAYAVGAGKAVVSTPYWYAEELLADDRGMLVPFRDPTAMSEAINYLFANDTKRNQMRKRAYTYCRDMVWKQVAREYLLVAQQAVNERSRQPRVLGPRRKRVGRAEELPEVDLRHLHALTDDVGLLQHCIFSTPNRNHGYCVDDNGRALVACALYMQLYRLPDLDPLATIYLSYLLHSFNEKTGRFRNFMSYERKWLDALGSEDSHARALWGLGMMASHANNESLRAMSVALFQQAVGAVEKFTSPRAWAYSLLGIHAYLEHYGGDAGVRRIRAIAANKLFELFRKNVQPDWQWCEPIIAYSNATLPHALILSGTWIPNGEMREQGLRSLAWLCDIQYADRGHFSFIGNQGWYSRGQERARFDQQPIEAMQTCLACAEAYRAVGDEQWLMRARRSLEWFLGRNDLGATLYDFATGGCCDGLAPDGANLNQGGESTLSWLISLLSFLIQVSHQTLEVKSEQIPADSVEKTSGRVPHLSQATNSVDAAAK